MHKTIVGAFSGGVLAAALLLFSAAGCSSSGNAAETEADAGNAPVRVEIGEITRRPVARVLTYTGDVLGEVEVRVFSMIPDRVVSLRVEEGQTVREGEVLAIIRSDALSQGVQQALGGLGAARAQVEGLRDTLTRQRRLLASGVVTQAQVDATEIQLRATENQVAQLDATVGSARTRRSDATIRAPISGIIGQVFVEEGDMAAPQIPICTVVQMDRVEVHIQVSEQELGLISTGMEAEIRVATAPGEVFRAPVSRISPVVDRMSRTATLRIVLDNPEHRLRPGSLAEVSIEVDRHDNAIMIPQYSLVLTGDTGEDGEAIYEVFVIEGTTARSRRLRLGFFDGDDVEVLAGLSDDERLVVQGQHLLRDGARVLVEATRERRGADEPEGGGEPSRAGEPEGGGGESRDDPAGE